MKKTQGDKLFDRMPGKLKKLHQQAKAEKRQNLRELYAKQQGIKR